MDKYGCRIRLCSKLWLQMLWCQTIRPSTTATQYIIFAEYILQNVKKFNKSFYKFCWYGFIFFINILTAQYRCAHHARQLLCHSITWSLYDLIYYFWIVSLLPYGEKNLGNTGSSHSMSPDGTKPQPDQMLTIDLRYPNISLDNAWNNNDKHLFWRTLSHIPEVGLLMRHLFPKLLMFYLAWYQSPW